MVEIIESFTEWLWGWPLLALVIGGGLIINIRTGFIQLRYFPYVMKQTFGKMFSKDDGGFGTVSAFQAMTTALASSIGAANIVVVPTIIFAAGPGAIFWMWITAIIGQGTKFAEVALSIKYREKNDDGDYVGGCSYMLKNGLKGKLGKALGGLAAFFFMIEILPSITLQTLAAAGPIKNVFAQTNLNENLIKNIAIVVIFILVSVVVFGGVKQIGRVTEKMVPIMASLYVLFGIIIILMHISELPRVIGLIFKGAFDPLAVVGGVGGVSLSQVISKGVARGVYSNEAGMGSAGYGHAAATTDHPARQGMWGIFEVFADTIVVCTISALTVLLTGIWQPNMSKEAISQVSAVAVERAFNTLFGQLGSIVVSISLFLFVLSTIIVIVFYCEKQAEYLWGTRIGKLMRLIASLMIILGIFVSFDKAGVFLDFTLGLVVIPNMIGLVVMSREVAEIKKEFFDGDKYYKLDQKNKK
ncbi:sodium:alanine symporter family protein [uncultured Anaerococcus sp.]|uniref:alanine/glycine:cation symporter family protein n=1 Tax=uncultured Anaerococcus sp. TaxID=293428 RepID=UPI002616C9AE|nr:amino acid carrier protein [uncultured Anaerococcus sp.]